MVEFNTFSLVSGTPMDARLLRPGVTVWEGRPAFADEAGLYDLFLALGVPTVRFFMGQYVTQSTSEAGLRTAIASHHSIDLMQAIQTAGGDIIICVHGFPNAVADGNPLNFGLATRGIANGLGDAGISGCIYQNWNEPSSFFTPTTTPLVKFIDCFLEMATKCKEADPTARVGTAGHSTPVAANLPSQSGGGIPLMQREFEAAADSGIVVDYAFFHSYSGLGQGPAASLVAGDLVRGNAVAGGYMASADSAPFDICCDEWNQTIGQLPNSTYTGASHAFRMIAGWALSGLTTHARAHIVDNDNTYHGGMFANRGLKHPVYYAWDAIKNFSGPYLAQVDDLVGLVVGSNGLILANFSPDIRQITLSGGFLSTANTLYFKHFDETNHQLFSQTEADDIVLRDMFQGGNIVGYHKRLTELDNARAHVTSHQCSPLVLIDGTIVITCQPEGLYVVEQTS